ncbi:MAG: nitrite reductase small subunit NirD [Reinekea forsetii]|nr:nitrite reductase small subunit NirD [Reinekea forsetii]
MTTIDNREWLLACTKADLVAQSGVAILVKNQQIALFYLPENDTIYALSNYCPFSRANVIARGIIGDLKGQLVVASPIYKQHFCLLSGACLEDSQVALNVYDVKVQDDLIQIAL